MVNPKLIYRTPDSATSSWPVTGASMVAAWGSLLENGPPFVGKLHVTPLNIAEENFQGNPIIFHLSITNGMIHD